MNYSRAESLVNRIISGLARCKIKDVERNVFTFIIKTPSRYSKYLASEIYNDLYEEFLNDGMFNDSELSYFLLENNIWDSEKESKMESLKNDMEELKVNMYNNCFDFQRVEASRRVLNLAKQDFVNMHERKNSYNYLSASGLAEIEKNKFIVASSLYDLKNNPLVEEESYWKLPSFILEQVLLFYKNNRISESDMRWIARNEPWRSYWIARKSESSLIGCAPVDMSEDQRSIIVWSSIYDNVYEHPEQPPNNVISDDDLLDGWFIEQRRKKEKDSGAKEVNNMIGNSKISNSGEVFVVANSRDTMKKIASLNNVESDIAKRQRFAMMDKKGVVKESEMPDSKNEIRKKQGEMYREKVIQK